MAGYVRHTHLFVLSGEWHTQVHSSSWSLLDLVTFFSSFKLKSETKLHRLAVKLFFFLNF
jgi:hypothetical protein